MSGAPSPSNPEQISLAHSVCIKGQFRSPRTRELVLMLICEFVFVLVYNKCDVQAKQQYEREQRRKELKRQRGEDTWILPEVNQRLQEIQNVRYSFFFMKRW